MHRRHVLLVLVHETQLVVHVHVLGVVGVRRRTRLLGTTATAAKAAALVGPHHVRLLLLRLGRIGYAKERPNIVQQQRQELRGAGRRRDKDIHGNDALHGPRVKGHVRPGMQDPHTTHPRRFQTVAVVRKEFDAGLRLLSLPAATTTHTLHELHHGLGEPLLRVEKGRFHVLQIDQDVLSARVGGKFAAFAAAAAVDSFALFLALQQQLRIQRFRLAVLVEPHGVAVHRVGFVKVLVGVIVVCPGGKKRNRRILLRCFQRKNGEERTEIDELLLVVIRLRGRAAAAVLLVEEEVEEVMAKELSGAKGDRGASRQNHE